MRIIFNEVIEQVNTIKHDFDDAIVDSRARFHYTVRRGKVFFDRKVRRRFRQERIRSWQYLLKASPTYILTAPVIYGMVIPLALLDITITLYQQICFRVYGIPRVSRSQFLRFDRHRLPYLNSIEKLNCVYCSYGNGIVAYAREVIARTEQFWCPIKNVSRHKGQHARTKKYIEYGDAQGYKTELLRLRDSVRRES